MERANKAFKKIKDRLSSPPVILFPDFSQLFTLTIDARDIACGAILIQEVENGRKKIKAVASHATEQNWSTTEREAYAIKWVISKFDYFLRNRPFVIFTDHRLLTYLDQRIFNNAKIRHWQEEISDYKFILEFEHLGRHAEQKPWTTKNQNTGWSYTSGKSIPGRGIRPHLGVWARSMVYN